MSVCADQPEHSLTCSAGPPFQACGALSSHSCLSDYMTAAVAATFNSINTCQGQNTSSAWQVPRLQQQLPRPLLPRIGVVGADLACMHLVQSVLMEASNQTWSRDTHSMVTNRTSPSSQASSAPAAAVAAAAPSAAQTLAAAASPPAAPTPDPSRYSTLPAFALKP